MALIFILFSFGLATGIIGRAKGSNFFIWFVIGFCLPVLGLITVIAYRRERDEPTRRCPRCGTTHPLYAQVCHRCGLDMYLPESYEGVPEPDEAAPVPNERVPAADQAAKQG